MVRYTITRRFAALIACCAILFATLAPSVAHAISAASGNAWTEICSAAGIKLVNVADIHGDPGDVQEDSHVKHCPFCVTDSSSLSLLPSSAWSVPLLKGRDTHPSLFFQSPSPLAIWTLAQSRAPPA